VETYPDLTSEVWAGRQQRWAHGPYPMQSDSGGARGMTLGPAWEPSVAHGSGQSGLVGRVARHRTSSTHMRDGRRVGRLGLHGAREVPNPPEAGGNQQAARQSHAIGNNAFSRSLVIGQTVRRVPENRGVPGSSPGLAIVESSCNRPAPRRPAARLASRFRPRTPLSWPRRSPTRPICRQPLQSGLT
jgi:hypothetical protein